MDHHGFSDRGGSKLIEVYFYQKKETVSWNTEISYTNSEKFAAQSQSVQESFKDEAGELVKVRKWIKATLLLNDVLIQEE